MNATYVRSIKKTPYEVVFGQQPNGFRYLAKMLKRVNEMDIADIIDENVEEEVEESNPPASVPIVDFSLHHQMSDTEETTTNPDKNGMNTTCPKRKEIRAAVEIELAKNAEMMRKKYSRGKRRKVADYQLSDHVSVTVKKNLRHSSDIKRIPCVVAAKSSGNQPTYRLLCQVGTLEKRYTASVLMPYPGPVRCQSPPEKMVSLSEAVRIIVKKPPVYCGCSKSGCKTKQCHCFAARIKCSTRCHKATPTFCKIGFCRMMA